MREGILRRIRSIIGGVRVIGRRGHDRRRGGIRGGGIGIEGRKIGGRIVLVVTR